ncbi:ABC transporter substrate binding protein [Desulfococcaceae bacterium HSG9]|nr:ABC transporter substrate binding protein [Desulfococcaceae bacterium HSG9]
MKEQRKYVVSVLVVVSLLFMSVTVCQSAAYKVLVVFSYGTDFPWVREIKAGIDSVLAEKAEIRYFYMNTKKNLEGGPQKAEEALAVYKEFQPDGVITADDNAQSMFVVPYLKDKVKTPVMFCGVNAEPEKYGYPASNVSGVLERMLVRQSLALAQKLVPAAKTVAIMGNESPSAKAGFNQIKKEQDTYSAKIVAFEEVKTIDEMLVAAQKFNKTADLLYLAVIKGIKDKNGEVPTESKTMSILTQAYSKPVIGTIAFRIKAGALCGVLVSGHAQGAKAAEKLLKAMQGTPVAQIPITTEIYGKHMINIDMLKALKIKPSPSILRSAELVRLEKAAD